MRYFLDTEFIEDGKTIDLISIGIVAEDGREYYAQSLDCKLERANDWVTRNVLTNLAHLDLSSRERSCRPSRKLGEVVTVGVKHGELCSKPNGFDNGCPWRYRQSIAHDILEFCDPKLYGKPEFWGYYADYDWVVLCQLFGAMINLPKGWPMYCKDLKQLCDDLGNPNLGEAVPQKDEHHALADARWNKDVYAFLTAREYTLIGAS